MRIILILLLLSGCAPAYVGGDNLQSDLQECNHKSIRDYYANDTINSDISGASLGLIGGLISNASNKGPNLQSMINKCMADKNHQLSAR
jgi:hypothetical protein